MQLGLSGVTTSIFGILPKFNFAGSAADINKWVVVHEGEGEHILTRRKVPITVKISKKQHGIDNISFCMEDMIPGRRMRVHKHLKNDELIFIHRGNGTLTLDDQRIGVETGSVVFIPRGTWHGLDNTGNENLQMVFQYSPAGFEEYFIENGTPPGLQPRERTEEALAITERKYGMVYQQDPRKQ